MSATYTIKEAGYAYVYLSNEHPTLVDVYFDDVKSSYTPSNVIQSNEYYPFGLQTANSWTRENTTSNNFLGNGSTELNTTSNLYDLEFRNYDPVLGRMHQVDPMAGKYGSWSPYNFSFNDPVTFNDPNGASPVQQTKLESQTGWYINGPVTGGIMDTGTYGGGGGHVYPGSGGFWADGNTYSDWSLNGGSQMYRNGLAGGLSDQGGRLYRINANGSRDEAQEINGELGFWVDVVTDWYRDKRNKDSYLGTTYNYSYFKAFLGSLEKYPLDVKNATFTDIMKAFRYAHEKEGTNYYEDIFDLSTSERSTGNSGSFHVKLYKGILINFVVTNRSLARSLIGVVEPYYKGQRQGSRKRGWDIDESTVRTEDIFGPIDYPYSIAIFGHKDFYKPHTRFATVFFSDIETFRKWKNFISGN